MYKNHAIECQRYCRESANNLADCIMMVSLSIQQDWDKIGIQLDDLRLNGLDSRFIIWKMKQDTYKYLQRRKHFLYGSYLAVVNSYKSDDHKALSLMKLFTRLDGINTAKAGFICQLSAGLVGCIDIHNSRLYDIDLTKIAINKKVVSSKGHQANLVKIKDYVSVCHKIGTSKLWDTWCNARAIEDNNFASGYEVSEAHINYLINQT